jgi:UDP-glucuronate 4-epimerase
MKKVLVTGAAGFIGFHLSELLLKKGWGVVGVDSMSEYYDIRLKDARLKILKKNSAFTFYKQDLSEYDGLLKILNDEKPDEIVHLAAQAGVRYSLVNPWAYASANYLGTLNVFEAAKAVSLPRVVYASSSSVYGANTKSPFSEEDRVDQPVSLYAASKKANEVLAYSYHHLYKMEMVGLRFFTVYGRWGRPDMALFKFARRIIKDQPIEVYNDGKMKRSFTHVSDIVSAVATLLGQEASSRYELYNLGGAEAVQLMHFVELIEKNLGKKAEINFLPLQAGDVPDTVADCTKAESDFGFKPLMSVEDGIKDFIAWFEENKDFLEGLTEPKQ